MLIYYILSAALILVSLGDYMATQKNRASGGSERGLFKTKGGQQFITLACVAMALILPWAAGGPAYGSKKIVLVIMILGVLWKGYGWRSNLKAMKRRGL